MYVRFKEERHSSSDHSSILFLVLHHCTCITNSNQKEQLLTHYTVFTAYTSRNPSTLTS